ncbi:MAG: sulfur carrier protein ThiS [Bacteroidaceae bacterium]|nr:sulfur carrier protein ThiS [Bacteroidaceae bacterium]
MTLTINNQSVETSAHTLSELGVELSLPESGVAIAVNNRMIPRAEWETHALSENMQIVIIKAACGG